MGCWKLVLNKKIDYLMTFKYKLKNTVLANSAQLTTPEFDLHAPTFLYLLGKIDYDIQKVL